MSNKTEKSLRRVVRREYENKIIEVREKAENEAVVKWLTLLFQKPLKERIRVAFRIVFKK